MNGAYVVMLSVEQTEEGQQMAARFEESQRKLAGEVSREDTTGAIMVTRRLYFEIKEGDINECADSGNEKTDVVQ